MWFLEGYLDNTDTMRRLRLEHFPFSIGRNPGLDLSIESQNVSRFHAEIFQREGTLIVKDLNSTNGSFINHKPVHLESAIKHGDILHIADVEIRVIFDAGVQELGSDDTHLNIGRLASKLPPGLIELEEMFAADLVSADFQGIVNSCDETHFAYEILGRGTHPNLPRFPIELFKIAENADREIALSELLRSKGVKLAADTGSTLKFFMNIHPRELVDLPRLLDSVKKLRETFPQPQLVLEIHERAVTDINLMKTLRARLDELHIGLAYDDFGAGETRLLELAEVPPDYLKFDITLIRNIDRSVARREMTALLLQITKTMNVKALAEGVCNQQEAAACRALGFDLLQGFYYSRPAALCETN